MPSPEEPRRKITRREEEPNSVPQLSSLPLKDALGNILTSGHLADVIFLVGGNGERKREIPAHKVILSARSEVFGAMVEERWNNSVKSGEGVARIEIGPEINPDAFGHLIKFIYNDDLKGCLEEAEFMDSFHLRVLADMYGFTQLRDATAHKIAMDIVKDYKKCFLTLEKELIDKDLRDVAFSVLKMNMTEALFAEDVPTKWTYEIWESVLSNEAKYFRGSVTIEEIDLFKNLCRWRNHDLDNRKESFQELLKLVRFPLMGTTSLLKDVRESHVLSENELLDILQWKLDKETPELQKPRINFNGERRKRSIVWARNTKVLNMDLDQMNRQKEIILLPGTYYDDINITKDSMKLSGFGPYTIFGGRKSLVVISGNDTTLENITIRSQMFILGVTGNSNVVRNVVGKSENQLFGLIVEGARNTFDNFTFQSRLVSSDTDFKANCTEFSQLCHVGLPVKYRGASFVVFNGPMNKVSNFDCSFVFKNLPKEIPYPCQFRYQTMFMVYEEDNVIENVNFEVRPSIFDEESAAGLPSFMPPFGARLCVKSKGLRVSNCCFTEVKVKEGIQNDFRKIIVSGTASIDGFHNKFEDCRFGKVTDVGIDTVLSRCVTVPEWLDT